MGNSSSEEGPRMPDYRRVLFGSAYLSNVQKFYGWSAEVAAFSLNGMAASLEELQDWRVDNMLVNNRDYNLALGPQEGGAALEIGFGTGSLTICARRRGLNIMGIDYTADYMRVARELARLAGFDDREAYRMFRQGDVRDLRFASNHFSLITASGILQYVDDILASMREILRTLRPGGILLLDAPDYRFPYESTYNIPWIPFMKKDAAAAWLEGFEKPDEGLAYIHYISLPHCLGIMKAVGFKILDAHTTLAESEIPRQIEKVLMGQMPDDLADDPEKVFLLARRVDRAKIQVEPCSFLITAQKPLEGAHPMGCHSTRSRA
jgi:SAM-dependent methyltransferase